MSRNSKQYSRNMEGLVDALFDQLQDIRDGISTPAEAMAFAKNAEVMLEAVKTTQRERSLLLLEREEARNTTRLLDGPKQEM